MLTTSVTLLQRVREHHDQAAWGRFVELYAPLILRWARRAGLSENDAADLVQEVLVVLLRELPSFDYDSARGRFRGWLKTVTINKCREQQRKRHPETGVDAAEPWAASPDLERFWEDEYRQHLVARALEIMKSDFEPKTWEACYLHVVSDKSAAEVGALLEMSEAAVYVAKSRVLRRLRQELNELLD